MRAWLSAIGILGTLALAGCAGPAMPDPGLYKGGKSEKSSPQGLDNTNGSSDGKPTENSTPASEYKTEKACADAGFYFDLVTNECTNRRLVKVTCTVDNITNPAGSDFKTLNPQATTDFLADNQKSQVKFLFMQGELKDFTLKYCVDDVQQYTLVAVKEVNGQKQVQDIDVPR